MDNLLYFVLLTYVNLIMEERDDFILLFELTRFFSFLITERLPAAPVLRFLPDLKEKELLLDFIDFLLDATDADDFLFLWIRVASVSISSESPETSLSSSESPSTLPIINFPSFDCLN